MKPQILTIFPHPAERYIEMPRAMTEEFAGGAHQYLEPGTSAVEVVPSIESLILRKLLAEIEARQVTRVPPTYVIEQPPPARQVVPVRALWGLLWMASVAIAVLTVKYFDVQALLSKSSDTQSRSIENLNERLAHQNETFATLVSSLQQLAGTVASNSKRTEEMPEMLARLGTHLPQIRPQAITLKPELAVQPAAPEMPAIFSRKEAPAPIEMGGHIHPPIEWAVTPSNVVAHHNLAGTMDYWLVPRTQSGVPTMVKVVPILQTNSGTFVHHIAEVKDYIVTVAGDWNELSKPAGTKE